MTILGPGSFLNENINRDILHSIQRSAPELEYGCFRIGHRALDVRPQSGSRDGYSTHFLGHVGDFGSTLEAVVIVFNRKLEDDLEELRRQM